MGWRPPESGLTHTESRKPPVEENPTRICELSVGLGDVEALGVVGRDAHPVADVAAELGCDWHTANRAVLALGRLGRTLARWHTPVVNLSQDHTRREHNSIMSASNGPPSDSAASCTTASARSSTPANPTGRSSPASLPAEIRSAS